MKCSWIWYGTRIIPTIPGKRSTTHKQPAKETQVAPDLPDYVKSVYGVGYKFEV